MLLENLKCLENPSARQGCYFLSSGLPRNLSIPSVALHSGGQILLLQFLAFACESAAPWAHINNPNQRWHD